MTFGTSLLLGCLLVRQLKLSRKMWILAKDHGRRPVKKIMILKTRWHVSKRFIWLSLIFYERSHLFPQIRKYSWANVHQLIRAWSNHLPCHELNHMYKQFLYWQHWHILHRLFRLTWQHLKREENTNLNYSRNLI